MTSADGNGVYLTHEEHAALLAEQEIRALINKPGDDMDSKDD